MRKHLAAFFAVATLVLVPSAIAVASYTWSDVDASSGTWYSLAVSDTGLVGYSSQHRLATPFAGRVWKTSDGGASWTELTASPARANWSHVATSGDGQTVAGVGYLWDGAANDTANFGDIQISRNGGTSWALANTETNRQWTGLAMSRDGNTLVATAKSTDGTNGVVMKSVNGGATWSDITPSVSADPAVRLHGGHWARVALSSDGTRIITSRDSVGLYTSSDGGTSWTQTLDASGGIWPSIKLSGDGRYAVASNDFYSSVHNGVWVSSDYGMSWTQTYVGTGASPTAVARDGGIMAFAKYGEKLYVSRNNGATWSAEDPVDSTWVGIGFNQSGERLIAVAEGGLARFATSTTTTTTTTTSTTVAPATTEAPATTAAATTSTTTSSSTMTATAPPTTVVTMTSTIVDSPPPAVTPSMVETFKPKPLVKDEQVAAGETVTVRISGFQPFELVSIGFDDGGGVTSQAVGDPVRAFAGRKVLTTVRADATGTISVQTKLPASVSGPVTLWAYGRESKVGFRQKFTVAELPATGSQRLDANLMLAGSLVVSGAVLFGLRRRLRR
jgi:LPXTG-motif cell wall-anchored protein